jgi:hypothetical protein
MDVALVGLTLPEVSNHSLETLRRAVADAGMRAETLAYAGFADADRVARRVMAARPSVVGISIQTTAAGLSFLGLARLLRRRGYEGRIVCGGHHATLHAEDIVRTCADVDAVVRFAGERALVAIARDPSVLDDARGRELPGIVLRGRDGQPERGAPADLPSRGTVRDWVVPDVHHHLGTSAVDLVASHGCEASCAYCCVAAVTRQARSEARAAGREADVARQARTTVADLADHVARLFHERGVRVLNLMDDNLLPLDPDEALAWISDLRSRLERADVGPIALSMQLRGDVVTEAVADGLAELGLVRAYVGVDGASDAQLRVLGRASDAVAGPTALERLWRRGVHSVCNALLVGPTIPFSAVERELEGLGRIAHAPLHLMPLDVRAGTALHARVSRLGLLEGHFLLPRVRFVDPRTEMLARILAAFPSRFAVRSPPLALYDLGYNAGIARRLFPELDLQRVRTTYERVSSAWNEDQLRVLRLAMSAARSLDEQRLLALVTEERPRVARLDAALVRACDAELELVERWVSELRGHRVRAHRRSAMLAGVALSMALAACSTSHERMGDAGATDAGPEAAVLDAAGDAGVCALGEAAQPFLDCSQVASECAPDISSVRVDIGEDGAATAVHLDTDAGPTSGEIEACILEMLAGYCYPSHAGETLTVMPYCWIA